MHGDPIALSETEFERLTTQVRAGGEKADGLTVDTTDRTDVLRLFHCEYLPSEDYIPYIGWNGDILACDEDTVSQTFHDDTLRRINYYRAMAGLNADITFNPVKNAKAQLAALIFARNCGLSHHPIAEHPAWSCLTADGDEAADRSNISYSTGQWYCGPPIVDGQMRDAGASNAAVGHRRWLLYSRALEMGNGGVPDPTNTACSAGVIWVIGDFAPAPASPAWTSWPNAGYCPYPVVWPRWSFSLPGAPVSCMDNATVTMSREGSPIGLTIIHPTTSSPAAGYGDPTIVWEPAGLPAGPPNTNTTYHITVSGITGTTQSSYNYDVIVMDPYTLDQEIVVTGPANPPAGIDHTYTFTPIAGATAYSARQRTFQDATWLEGAEPTDPNRLVDYTDPDYSLAQSALVYAGSQAFQMAFPDFTDQWFEIDRTILPGDSSQLHFVYRRRFSHLNNTIAAQVSTDDGTTWSNLWTQPGLCSGSCSTADWDPAWLPAAVSLAPFNTQPIRLRFLLAHNGNAYIGTTSNHGVFLDNITVTDAQLAVDETITPLPATSTGFTLHPDGPHTYLLDVQPEIGCTWFPYGPTTLITATPALPTITIQTASPLNNTLYLQLAVTGGNLDSLWLDISTNSAATWTSDPTATYDTNLQRFTTTPPPRTSPLYRIRGTSPP